MKTRDVDTMLSYFTEVKKEYRDIYIYKDTPGKVKRDKTNKSLDGLLFPIYGCAKFTIEDETYTLKPGSILYAAPNISLDIEIVGDTPWYCLIVVYDKLNDEKFKDSFQQSHCMLEIGISANIMYKLSQLAQSEQSIDLESSLQTKILFNELMEEITKILKNPKDKSINNLTLEQLQMLNEVIYYIQTNYDKPLSVSDIAKKFGMERRKFGHLFKLYTGASPVAYIIEFKMSKAKYLLKFSDSPVKEIARGLGYEDYFYFSKKFKETVGVSPSQFRNEIK